MARYYDANTRRFLLVGPGGGTHTIHRELWGPGVSSAAEAVDHVHHLLAERFGVGEPDPARSVLDLGCGVGGSMLRLAELLPDASLTGVTLSARQVEIGERLVAERALGERVRFVHGDLRSADLGRDHDAAFAIESFVHGPEPERFFEAAGRALRPGGRLYVVDDFLARPESELPARARRVVEDFRTGWRVPGLCTPERCRQAARAGGFEAVEHTDLTGLVRLGRPRDRVIRALSPALRALRLQRIPFFGNMVGGDALQRGLAEGFLSYRLEVFRRVRVAP